ERKFADAESLRPVVRAAFGRDRALLRAERLAGGSKKGAYRLTMDDGGTALAYAWNDSEDYWQGALPEDAGDPAGPFSHASGLALFEAAARRLASAGARCPEILFTDRSRSLYPADVAVVEDIAGGSLEALLDKDPVAAERPLSVLADWLAAMAAIRSPSLGKVAFVDAGGRSPRTSCEGIMLDRALGQLREIAGRDRRAAGAQGRLEEALHALAGPVEPRVTWALIHGELGPDHVLLDRRGEPALIDIEGAKNFEVEAEHVWTRMRFAGHYARLSGAASTRTASGSTSCACTWTWSRDPCGSPAPATPSASGPAGWPSITSSVPCGSRPSGNGKHPRDGDAPAFRRLRRG
ncbi:MAG: phosphotransferase family protein, partial [Trebonia sp.]